MFTFSFNTAFADISTDEVTELKTYATTLAQGYYGEAGKIAKTAQSYLDKITYDEDGYVFNMNELKGYVKADVIKAYMADVIDEAEKAFSNNVANDVIGQITTGGTITTKTQVQTAIEIAYTNAINAMTEKLTDGNSLKAAVIQELVAKQYKVEKADADAALAAIKPEDYSDSLDEWKFNPSDNTGVQKFGWDVVGLTSGKDYTARGYVKGILDAQAAKIFASETTAKTNAKEAIDALRTAVKVATQSILGHKIEAAPNDYYIKAIPTIADLKGDTTVEAAKTNALAQIKAALAAKQVVMGQAIQDGIDALNKYNKLSDSQKELLATLNDQKAELAKNFAAYEEVTTSKVNYKTTTDAVKSYCTAVLAEVNSFTNDANGKVSDATQTIFNVCNNIVKNVKTLKNDAALLALQKDVNGKPFYDADVLAANLEDAIEAAYNGTTYDECYDMLAGGNEFALINAKIAYIDFISGNATPGFVPVDSKGYKVTKVWNKASAENRAETITFASEKTWNDGVTKMYDKAQKDGLKALVKETKASITDAKTIAEIEKIFAEANDKYNDIATTDDHQNAWKTGKVKAAYDKAGYDKDLRAYVKYFLAKVDGNDYTDELDTEDEVMSTVVYPVIYEAYAAEELADKVTEAKAAVDAIKTKEQVKAEKLAVEAAIKALPKATDISLSDKEAIEAAADLLYNYLEIPGTNENDITNVAVLEAAAKAYEIVAAKEVKAAYDALKNKDITTSDAKAVEELRDLFDAHADFVSDYNNDVSTLSTPNKANVEALEKALSEAKIAEAKELMIKLPVNPTAKDKAAVKAARDAYEALTLNEKLEVVNTLAYKNLIDAEEFLGISNSYAVKSMKLRAYSKYAKKGITVKWVIEDGRKSDAKGYQVWRSTKANSRYKKLITVNPSYGVVNAKNLKKGVTYYYKVRAYNRTADGKLVFSDWSNKAYRKAR